MLMTRRKKKGLGTENQEYSKNTMCVDLAEYMIIFCPFPFTDRVFFHQNI